MSDLEQLGIERLKAASQMSLQHYGQPLIITDSGGKDSSVVKELALRSGIPFEIMHNHTTADAPETVRFIRQEAKRFEDLGIKYTITDGIRTINTETPEEAIDEWNWRAEDGNRQNDE